MKKLLLLMVITFLVITALAVNKIDFTLNPQAYAKDLEKAPLTGEWVVKKYVVLDSNEVSEEEGRNILGKGMDISLNGVIFDEVEYKDVKFKVKLVESSSFLWDMYKIKPGAIGIKKSELNVVTVFSNNRYLEDLIILDDNNIIKSYNGILLFLGRAGSEDSSNYTLNKDLARNATAKEKEIKSKSGLLLGLKCKESGELNYSYRTIWLSYEKGKIKPVLQMKNLLVPRTNGFSKVGLEENITDNNHVLWVDTMSPQPQTGGWRNITNKKFIRKIPDGDILFIGDSYISIDTGQESDKKLLVLPLDNISGEGMNIKKLLGKNAEAAFLSSAKLNKERVTNDDSGLIDLTNWGIIRRSGRWTLRGRLSFKEKPITDFDVPYPAPKLLVNYDDTYPFQDDLKEAYPNALDIFCSPNRDLVIIVTEKKLLLVTLSNNKHSEVKATFDLKENETIIMDHWATGSYVDEWGKKVK